MAKDRAHWNGHRGGRRKTVEIGQRGNTRARKDHHVVRAIEKATSARLRRAAQEQEKHEEALRELEARLAASVERHHQDITTTTTEEIAVATEPVKPGLLDEIRGKLLVTKDVAERLGVTAQTVTNLAAAGTLPIAAEEPHPRGIRRLFDPDVVAKFAETYKPTGGSRRTPTPPPPKKVLAVVNDDPPTVAPASFVAPGQETVAERMARENRFWGGEAMVSCGTCGDRVPAKDLPTHMDELHPEEEPEVLAEVPAALLEEARASVALDGETQSFGPDDTDLTAADVGALLDAGKPVEVKVPEPSKADLAAARELLGQGYHVARVALRTGVPVVALSRYVGKDGYAK